MACFTFLLDYTGVYKQVNVGATYLETCFYYFTLYMREILFPQNMKYSLKCTLTTCTRTVVTITKWYSVNKNGNEVVFKLIIIVNLI